MQKPVLAVTNDCLCKIFILLSSYGINYFLKRISSLSLC